MTLKKNKNRNLGRGIKNSKPRADSFNRSRVTPISSYDSFNRSRVTPILDLNELIRNTDSFDRSRVTPILDDLKPMESPYKTLSPNMFRLVYEGDLNKNLSGENTYDEDGNIIVDFDLPLYDSIDKPGRFSETIYQRAPNYKPKYKSPYDIENPNPFWSNSNEDFGQYVELSKSSSPNLGRGITKRKYKKHNKKSHKKHNKKSHKKHSKKSRRL